MSDSVRPHRRQPTRVPHPWDSPGKNTGVYFVVSYFQCFNLPYSNICTLKIFNFIFYCGCKPLRLNLLSWIFLCVQFSSVMYVHIVVQQIFRTFSSFKTIILCPLNPNLPSPLLPTLGNYFSNLLLWFGWQYLIWRITQCFPFVTKLFHLA